MFANFRSVPAALAVALLSATAISSAAVSSAVITPVAANGKLHVNGNFLCNQKGDTVQLRGLATHGMQWFNKFYADGQVIEAAADQWGADVIRLTVYLSEGGYLTSKTIKREQFDAWIDAYVNACVRKGMYVILDWHVHKPGYPGYYLNEAKAFFEKTSAKYGGLPNVLWEICNEPSSASLTAQQSDTTGTDAGHYVEWSEIAQYADQVIPIIRKGAPNAVVLVGTPSWSTLGISTKGDNAWQEIADHPLSFPNVMYVIHYYAASHGFQGAFEKASARLPLFATEWATAGFQETSANDPAKGQAFVEMLRRHRIGWTYWNLSNATPGIFAVFDSTTKATGPFAPTGGNVTPTGKLVYGWLSEPGDAWKDLPTRLALERRGGMHSAGSLPVLVWAEGKLRGGAIYQADGRQALPRLRAEP